MGTSYDAYCLDCDSEAGVHASYSPIRFDAIEHVLASAPRFAGLDPSFVCDVELRVAGVTVPIEWLAKHGGHRLRAKDEYGRIDTTCSRELACPTCKRWTGYCELDADHEGAHGPRPKK